MEAKYPTASLRTLNSDNRHDLRHELRQMRSNDNVGQQVRDYNRANSRPGLVSRAFENTKGYELIGSVAAIAIVGSIFTAVI